MDKVVFCVEADPRPTCVLDLISPDGPSISYQNSALLEQRRLLDVILDPNAPGGIQEWARGSDHAKPARRDSIFAYTIDSRWRIVQWQNWRIPSEHEENGHNLSRTQTTPEGAAGPPKTDPLTLSRELRAALADRNDATGKLSNLLKMMEMVDVGMFEYSKDGVLVYGNNAFHALSGVPVNEHTPMAWANWVFEEDRTELVSYWDQLLNGSPCTFDMRWIGPHPDQNPEGHWVSAACVPTTDDAGNVTTISGCITDMSAQKRSHMDAVKKAEALERAQASEKRFANFIKHSNVAFYNSDVDRKMSYCNREWFELSGHPVVPFEDIDWGSFMSPENLAIVSNSWDTMIQMKQPTKFQFELNRTWSDGHGHEMRASVLSCSYPELSEDGSVVAIAGTLTDITHLRWAEKLQKQRTDEAVEAKRQHEAFIDITCHEIRNPLGAVVHCADLVSSNLSDMKAVVAASRCSPELSAFGEHCEAALESVSTIISCCSHQRRIVDDILNLSKLDSKLLTIAPSLTDLDNMLSELEKMFEADAKKFDITLRLNKYLGNVKWAMLDTGRLMQVLINILTNAVKFTQNEAQRVININVGMSQNRPSEGDLDVEFVPAGIARERSHAIVGSGEEVYLYFAITDTGCGFDQEQKTRIFERFSQASPRTHSKYGGSGLGLFISREMIELQGGEIGVSSRAGHGATFAFYIAARTAEAPRAEQRRASTALLSRSRTLETDRPKLCILVVEDNLVNQKVLRMQLQKLGHEVHVVSHGGEALAFLRTTSSWKGNSASQIHLSIILMDIEMPIMNGLDCTRKIREAESEGLLQRRSPIIAVSANAREGQVRHAIECGVDDAISKPFRVADLMPMVERLVLV